MALLWPGSSPGSGVTDRAPDRRHARAVEACPCARDRLCDRCVEDGFRQLRGVAACRGEAWAVDVAKRCRTRQPWPRGERSMAIARRKVEDLTRDARLVERLADELERWAARRWSE